MESIRAPAEFVNLRHSKQLDESGAGEGQQYIGKGAGAGIAQRRDITLCYTGNHIQRGRAGHGSGQGAQQDSRIHLQHLTAQEMQRLGIAILKRSCALGQLLDIAGTDDEQKVAVAQVGTDIGPRIIE